MVLVLFVLMLLNMKTDPAGTSPGWGRLAVIVVAVVVVVVTVMPAILGSFQGIPAYELADRAQRAQGSVRNIGKVLYGDYVVQFELASLVLLVGVVGAVMLAKRKKGTALQPRALSEFSSGNIPGTGAN
jgi:NADH-quinone oxidoreductase subunit J